MKNASIYTYVKNIALAPDIVFLQETNDLSENSSRWILAVLHPHLYFWPCKWIWSNNFT